MAAPGWRFHRPPISTSCGGTGRHRRSSRSCSRPPQIALNLRAGMIDLALLSEAAVRPILERGLVRIVTRLPEPELEAALVLRKDWAAVHRSVALALREALASARLAS
jgi:ABC-type taurine transport system substrate-binding protein